MALTNIWNFRTVIMLYPYRSSYRVPRSFSLSLFFSSPFLLLLDFEFFSASYFSHTTTFLFFSNKTNIKHQLSAVDARK